MAVDKEEDVQVGAAPKGGEHAVIGTGIPGQNIPGHKDYVEPISSPFFDAHEFRKWSFWRAGFAEFMATLIFLYILIQTVMGHDRPVDPCDGVTIQGIAWAAGIAIFVLVYCTAGISGGHINPAVTFGLFLGRRLSVNRAIYYIICQCLGAICGAGIVKAFQPDFYQAQGGGTNSVAHGYTLGDGLGAEIVGTFLLVYTVFSATDAKRKARDSFVPRLAPLPIGFAVFVVHLATLPITGTSINPARSLGAAVIFNRRDNAWNDQWVFWMGPFIGAALASAYHNIVIRAFPFHQRVRGGSWA